MGGLLARMSTGWALLRARLYDARLVDSKVEIHDINKTNEDKVSIIIAGRASRTVSNWRW